MQTTRVDKLSSATRLPVLGKFFAVFQGKPWGTNAKVLGKNARPLPGHSSHLTWCTDVPHTRRFWALQPGSCYDTNFGGGVSAAGHGFRISSPTLSTVTRAAGSLKRDGLKIEFVREGGVISWALRYGH